MKEIKITSENYEEVLHSDKKVLLDFYADWCGPCKMLAPVLSEVAEERDDIIVGKINVDEEMELARAYGVASIPTLFVLKDGQVQNKSLGFVNKNKIYELLL